MGRGSMIGAADAVTSASTRQPEDAPSTGVTGPVAACADRPPVPFRVAMRSLSSCAASTVDLLARRRTHLPRLSVGRRLRFADGTSSWVYRETTVDRERVTDPCLLVVGFRLRFVKGWGHRLFRWESILNTPLFVGFPGLVSKWWLAADDRGTYRGIYDWDGVDRADHYARSLWWVLALVCDPRTIHYVVVPAGSRAQLLEGTVPETTADGDGWWRVVPDGRSARSSS